MMDDDKHALKHTMGALLRQYKAAKRSGAAAELIMQLLMHQIPSLGAVHTLACACKQS